MSLAWPHYYDLFPFTSPFHFKIGIISGMFPANALLANTIIIFPKLQSKTKYKPGLLPKCPAQLVDIGWLFLLKSSKICAMPTIGLGVIMVREIDIFISTRLAALECAFDGRCD